MQAFVKHNGIVAPLDRVNVDTDAIIPKQFLKRIERTGFGPFLFYDWRYLSEGRPNPDFVLNRPPFNEATILLARDNFGCGSSREHAPWALAEFGFRAIVAPSFADIFANNCFQNGILPVRLASEEIDTLFNKVAQRPGYQLDIDLVAETISDDAGWSVRFPIDPFRKECLLLGLDDIGLTLRKADKIEAFERRRAAV